MLKEPEDNHIGSWLATVCSKAGNRWCIMQPITSPVRYAESRQTNTVHAGSLIDIDVDTASVLCLERNGQIE